MEFAELSKATRVLWAKSGQSGGHGLLAHMLDIAAVAEAITFRESDASKHWAAASFGVPVFCLPRWLAAIAGLHDFGKAIPGFQRKWPEGQLADAATGLPFKSFALSIDRHDWAGAALLRRLLSSRFPSAQWIQAITRALGAHHGYMPSANEISQSSPRNEGQAWIEARQALFDAYWKTLSPEGEPAASEIVLPAVAWLAGLTSVADWIGSNQDWFPPGERGTTLEEHFQHARVLADAALDAIGWPGFHALLDGEEDSAALIGRILGLQGDKALALTGIGAYTRAMTRAIPTGKQNTFAAHNPPSFVGVVLRHASPFNLANAFEKPVWPRPDRELTSLSVEKLAEHDAKVAGFYGDGKDDWAYIDLTGAWPAAKGEAQANLDALAQWVQDKVRAELGG